EPETISNSLDVSWPLKRATVRRPPATKSTPTRPVDDFPLPGEAPPPPMEDGPLVPAPKKTTPLPPPKKVEGAPAPKEAPLPPPKKVEGDVPAPAPKKEAPLPPPKKVEGAPAPKKEEGGAAVPAPKKE